MGNNSVKSRNSFIDLLHIIIHFILFIIMYFGKCCLLSIFAALNPISANSLLIFWHSIYMYPNLHTLSASQEYRHVICENDFVTNYLIFILLVISDIGHLTTL